MVYVDEKRCSGCGVCIHVCRVGAIAVEHDVATIDQRLCNECEACLGACPEGAILTVTEPAVVPKAVSEVVPHEVQVPSLPLGTRLAPAVGAALFFVGREVVPRVADYLLEAFDRRVRRPSATGSDRGQATPSGEGPGVGGRRRRKRRRGG